MINPEKISKSKLQLISSLKLKKRRVEHGLFVAEGSKCVFDTLPYFRLNCLVVTQKWWNDNHDFLKQSFPKNIGIPVLATEQEMKKMTSFSTASDVMAVYERPVCDTEVWANGIEERLTLVLDGIQDPGNLGTIIRTADWFGIHHVFASKDTVDIYNSKAIQASMGAISRVRMIYGDIVKLVDKYSRLPVYGTLLDGENIYSANLMQKGFIIFGNEGKGISENIRCLITDSLLIPSYPSNEITSESLNVSAAAAVTLAEFRRRIIS